MPDIEYTFSSAQLSECERFRYTLTRIWDPNADLLVWMMLNPSTAHASKDDATIRRVRSFTQREGYGGFIVINVFAYRATTPAELHAHRLPEDRVNERMISQTLPKRDVIVAWGQSVALCPDFQRAKMLLSTARSVRCLGLTKGQRAGFGSRINQQPRHPVRLAKNTPLESWAP